MYINRRKGDRDYETETMNAISQHRVTNHGFSAELLSLARRRPRERREGKSELTFRHSLTSSVNVEADPNFHEDESFIL